METGLRNWEENSETRHWRLLKTSKLKKFYDNLIDLGAKKLALLPSSVPFAM